MQLKVAAFVLALVTSIALAGMESPSLDSFLPFAFLAQSADVRHITFYEPIPEEDQIDSRTARVVHFHRDSSGLSAFWEAGDLRFLSFGTDSICNVSRSASHGWNYGAYPYFHQGDLHLVGGYGFWRKHFDDIVFMRSRSEWERVGSSIGMNVDHPAQRDWFFRHHDGSIGCLKWGVSAERTDAAGSIWGMPKGGGNWSQVMKIPPLASASQLTQVFDLRESLLIGFRNGNLMWVDKRTWRAHVWIGQPDWVRLNSSGTPSALAVFNDRVEAWNDEELLAVLDENKLNQNLESAFLFAELVDDAHEEDADDADARPVWIWASLLFLGALPLAYAVGVRRSSGGDGAPWIDADESAPLVRPIFDQILEWDGDYLSIPEFDAFIEGADHLGPEGIRSRRAQLFREVNRLAQLELGQNLLERQRSPADSRTFLYRIKKPR
jgi:hypothetical protein